MPPFSDPGEAKRQAARDQLNRAREQLAEAGDGTSQLLHDLAQTAPQDSQKQADANFYGGIWTSVEGFGESLWTMVSDPGATISAMADNLTHPVQTLKDLVAWDDWASGHGDRALGKVTGDVLIGAATFGAGKVLKSVLKGAKGVPHIRGGPLPEASRLIDKGQEWTGAGRKGGQLPNEADPNSVLYKKDPQTGNVTNYTVYDDNGRAIKRIDIGDDKGHGDVRGSHVIEYKVNRDPRTGIERVQPDKGSVREARPDEIP